MCVASLNRGAKLTGYLLAKIDTIAGQLGRLRSELRFKVSPGKQQDSSFKITRAKWTGGLAQAVEHLHCKHEALSSKPIPPTKKTKQKPHTIILHL
jgi:hypothetical protein